MASGFTCNFFSTAQNELSIGFIAKCAYFGFKINGRIGRLNTRRRHVVSLYLNIHNTGGTFCGLGQQISLLFG